MRKLLTASGVAVALVLSSYGTGDPHGEIEEALALDNDSVRVALITIPAGASSGIHLNPEPEMGIVVEGELTLVTRRGKEVLTSGRVVFLPTGTGHDARNESAQPVKLWAVNLKKCQ